MTTVEWVFMHLYMSISYYNRLLRAKALTGMPIYFIVNVLLVYISRFLQSDFDLAVSYEDYIDVSSDSIEIKRPFVKLHRAVHFMIRNVKNRNFRASFSLLVRVGIDMLLDRVIEDIITGKIDEDFFLQIKEINAKKGRKKKDHGLYKFKVLIKTTPYNCYIKPFNPYNKRL